MTIKFKNEEHENRYYEILARMGSTDSYHSAVAYLLALDTDCYKHIESLYDFVEHGIIPWGALNQAWQTGTSVKTTRLIFIFGTQGAMTLTTIAARSRRVRGNTRLTKFFLLVLPFGTSRRSSSAIRI